ncbi:YbdD/YjiX family protein [Nocardioides ferulae]|uniref:YbdD/YjiX family protein n=1 Tax=Nocardioides ferulae TaxID=2340821 RepID=UPI0019805145|nr:YbdD/YjiX family protein [Nocardioides ferulae]
MSGPEPGGRLLGGVHGYLRWYLREISGAGRYQRYLDSCRAEGRTPLSRAAYERARVDHRERHPQGRCC